MKAVGTSMLPLLQPEDIIQYRKVAFENIRENDILLVKKKSLMFTHRVIYKTPTYLVTKGDNNILSDGNIYPRHILAKAYQIKRKNMIINITDLFLTQSFMYLTEINKVVAVYKKAGLDFLILKGLPLHLYYEKGQYPKRMYADCDILVDIQKADKAHRLLLKLGYTKSTRFFSENFKRLKNKKIEDTYVKKVAGFPVVFDLHYEVVFMMTQLGKLDSLYPQASIESLTRLFLQEKVEIVIDNKKYPILSQKHLFLYLALHFFHHNYLGVFRLSLINSIIRNTKIKHSMYKDMTHIIDKYRLNGYIYPVFVLLRKYFQTPIPQDFIDMIKPHKAQQIYARQFFTSNIFNDETHIQGSIHRFKHLFFLSPGHILKKGLIFFYPTVIYSCFWILQKKFASYAFPHHKK